MDDDGFMMIEKEEIESRKGVDDEEDKVEGKKTIFSLFCDTFDTRKFFFIIFSRKFIDM